MRPYVLFILGLVVFPFFGDAQMDASFALLPSVPHLVCASTEQAGPSRGSVSEITIPSSLDGIAQRAMFFAPESTALRPLLVVLHSWSSNYTADDPLSAKAVQAGWHYIHPDFRGPNQHPDACLSEKAIADIDDAIQYVLDRGGVDLNHIFVVGASGGGHATLGVYLRTRYPVKLFMAWVPISDLTSWYWESKHRNNKYAQDIVQCTSQTGSYDEAGARGRSPLYWEIPDRPGGRLELFAGITDGYTGSVPVSHSVFFFNKIARHFRRPEVCVPETDLVKLLARGMKPDPALKQMEGRDIVYQRSIPEVSLTIFEGGHEMLAEFCFARLLDAAAK